MSTTYNGEMTWLKPPAIYEEVKAALDGTGPTFIDYTTLPELPREREARLAKQSGKWPLFLLGFVALYFILKKG